MMKVSWQSWMLFALLCASVMSLRLHDAHEGDQTFCWKDSYSRGAGTIPTECGSRVKIGLSCYDECPNGFKRYGTDCHQTCLQGWRDDGLFCRLGEYGIGGGYAWKLGESLSSNGMMDRCQKDKGKGNCQQIGALVYPKCKSGYTKVGCCICRPSIPNCNRLGYNSGIDLSCAKKMIIGTPYTMSCVSDLENNAGLCYQKCKDKYNGVGPTCWSSETPKGWVDCGTAAATTSQGCSNANTGQIQSIGQNALNFATTVISATSATAVKDRNYIKKMADYKTKFEALKKAFLQAPKIKQVIEKAKQIKADDKKVQEADDKVKEQYEQANNVVVTAQEVESAKADSMAEADYARLAAQIAALADPSGIAGLVEKSSHPKCSQI